MTKEMIFIKQLYLTIGRAEMNNLLQNSSLTDREIQLLDSRIIHGTSLKDCSDQMGIEIDSVNKAQLKAVKKLYLFIKNKKNI